MKKFCYCCGKDSKFKVNPVSKKIFQHCEECRKKYTTKERNKRSEAIILSMLSSV